MHRDPNDHALWGNGHAHRHDHDQHHGQGHTHGHNGPPEGEHLHSHPLGRSAAEREELEVLASTFIDTFRQAADKTSWLRLAGVPFELRGSDGLMLKLVDVEIVSNWQVATASPGFGSRELVYLPMPGEMVKERTNFRLTYVSLTERRDLDLRTFLIDAAGEGRLSA
jgi:hypothetical protein